MVPADLTLVIDVGKSHARILMVDDAGMVVARYQRDNGSIASPLGYPALDVQGLESWMRDTVRTSGLASRCGRAIATTHGAAFVALGHDGLAWLPLDYEFDGLQGGTDFSSACARSGDTFASTLSPDLPAGLNAARQLFWLQDAHPDAWRRTTCLVPYAQYWTWLLSGIACTEVSSLGCHTHLWQPDRSNYSQLALSQGWAAFFAPMRSAWDVVGPVRDVVARQWGLPVDCQVHVGVHDSNSCLARYLFPRVPDAGAPDRLTLVSSGTWTVVMAPGAPSAALQAELDMLGNVDVNGRVTPTARFMGGREFAVLLDGATPDAADDIGLNRILDTRIFALPGFARQGGPFANRVGTLEKNGQALTGSVSGHLSAPERAALAALYCAQITCWLMDALWRGALTAHATVIVEGPLAHNDIYARALQTLLPQATCFTSTDALEGTARGAWNLAHWGNVQQGSHLSPVTASPIDGLAAYHNQWLQRLAHQGG
jgi:sugar (pentulose or hexulose) kinase